MKMLSRQHRTNSGLSSHGAVLGLLLGLALAGCSPNEPEIQGTEPRVRLVTTDQYANTLRYIFGPGINVQIEFPPFERKLGLLGNSAATAGISSTQLEQIQGAAASVARQVVDPANRDYLIPCKPANAGSADDACAAEFLSSTGRLLYGRPLNDIELATFVESAASGATRLKGFYAGLDVALEALLLSTPALFDVERAEPDPEHSGKLRLDAYSLASRLSYFLWNAGPDESLLEAAESGELQTKAGLASTVDRMLASPRLVDGMRAFFDDMFSFNDFRTVSKDPTIYPEFKNVTAVDAREQTLRTVINHLITEGKDYRTLFTTRSTFMSPALAVLFDIPAPYGWVPYTLPADSPRAGLLTQVSFLALHAHPGRSSATRRGVALRETLLCQEVPTAPPNVDFSTVNNPDAHYPTQRDRVNAHLGNPSCAGCHKIMDPIGLSLENFDGAGRFRLEENGTLIDVSGNLDGVEIKDAVDLAYALQDSPQLPKCLVQRVFNYSIGGPTNDRSKERAFLDYVAEEFSDAGYLLHDLLRTIATSDAFSRIQEPQSTLADPPPADDDEQPRAPAPTVDPQVTAAAR